MWENAVVFTWFGLLCVGAVALAVQSHLLYVGFRNRYPEVASRLFWPPGYRDGRKFLFLFDEENQELLRREPSLWRGYVRLKRLMIALAILGPGVFGVLFCVAAFFVFIRR